MANYVYNKIICTEEILNKYLLDAEPFEKGTKIEEPYITFNKLFNIKLSDNYEEICGASIYYGDGFEYYKIEGNKVEILFNTRWYYPIKAIVKAIELCKEDIVWYAIEESLIYASKFYWKDKIIEEVFNIEGREDFNKFYEESEDGESNFGIWAYKPEEKDGWKLWKCEDYIKRYNQNYSRKLDHGEIQKIKRRNPMYLRIDDYTDFELNIKIPEEHKEDYDDNWCKVTLSIENEYFKYHANKEELLLESELEELIQKLYKLTQGQLTTKEAINFIEPDLEITLIPSTRRGNELAEIRINLFQNGELYADYYNLCIDSKEIKEILKYLNSVLPTVKLKEETDNKKIEEKYCYVSVQYDDYLEGKSYFYLLTSNIEETNIGDKVIIDMAGEKTKGIITRKEFYNKENAPYHINKTKKVIKVLKSPEDFEQYKIGANNKFKCPCCGYYTIDEPDSFEICPVCYWSYDPFQSSSLIIVEGANDVNLKEAKDNYKKYNAIEEKFKKNVRFPKISETEYYDDIEDEEEILDILYKGTKNAIENIVKDFQIEYSFDNNINEFSIKINKRGIVYRGKGRINPEYNCIKYFGYKFNYKDLIKKCPNCNERLVDILYGVPTSNDVEKYKRKEIFLGGDTVLYGIEQAVYHCNKCNRNYYHNLIDYDEVKTFDLNKVKDSSHFCTEPKKLDSIN